MVLLDLDHFRRVNERYGHAGGDLLLGRLGAHVSQTLRDGDRVARYGGDEFLIVLPSCELGAATRVIDRIMQAWRDTDPLTTCSCGMATHRADQNVAQTLESADRALYEAKNQGRDRYCTAADLDQRELLPTSPSRRVDPAPGSDADRLRRT